MNKFIIVGIIFGIIILGGISWSIEVPNESLPPDSVSIQVNSFEECADAGFPVMESYPRQCRDAKGNTFVEDVGPIPVDYMITEIIDGDTVKVNGESVRFALASAPELNEPNGIEARQFIANLCPPGTFVSVDEDDGQPGGSYGRMLAVIYCEGKNLNSELLDAGLGVISTEFCAVSEFANDPWAQKHGCSVKPKTTIESSIPKSIPPIPESKSNQVCDPSYPTVCIAPYPPDLDCGDIPHKKFKVLQPDPHGFDRDKDGIGCES